MQVILTQGKIKALSKHIRAAMKAETGEEPAHVATLNALARWLGYRTGKDLLKAVEADEASGTVTEVPSAAPPTQPEAPQPKEAAPDILVVTEPYYHRPQDETERVLVPGIALRDLAPAYAHMQNSHALSQAALDGGLIFEWMRPHPLSLTALQDLVIESPATPDIDIDTTPGQALYDLLVLHDDGLLRERQEQEATGTTVWPLIVPSDKIDALLVRLDAFEVAVAYLERGDQPGLVLAGGGMNLSADLCMGYILAGYVPPKTLLEEALAANTGRHADILDIVARRYLSDDIDA